MTKYTHIRHRIQAMILVIITVPLSYLLKMKVEYKVSLYLLPAFCLSLSSYGFTQESSPVPQLHQKAPREISTGLINI